MSPCIVGRSLVLSDDSTTVEQLTSGMRQFAISADVCPDLERATVLINTRKFEAIVVDLSLGQNVDDFFGKVRLSPSNRNSVIFAISGDEDLGSRIPANFVITKPVNPEIVGSIFKAALGLIIRDYRRYFRCPLAIPVLITIDKKAQIQCEMVNISEGGMAIRTSAIFHSGAVVACRFKLPGQANALEMEAEVCWCDYKGRAGLQFRAMLEDQRIRLQTWLSEKIEQGIPDPVARLFERGPRSAECS